MANDFPGGLSPDSASDFYLLAILDELRAIRAALEPKPAPPARKPSSPRR